MNIATIKQAEKRIQTPFNSSLSIQYYGQNNLYPQDIVKIVSCSETASTCMDRYISFIYGNGFQNVSFSQRVLNSKRETADDILQLVSYDVANYRGFALQVNYNLLGEIVELFHVPFENCRLTEQDDDGYVGKIAVHPDWTGQLRRNGKPVRVTKENIDYIDIFNPDKDIVLEQIELAGGIQDYKGQILWISESGTQTYPKPVHDSVVTQMSTEEGLANVSNRNVRSNFLPACVLVFKKGQEVKTKEEKEKEAAKEGSLRNALNNLQGDLNTANVGALFVNQDEEIPKKIDLRGENYDKDFTVTTETTESKIYAAFNQEIWCRLKKGSIGFSSQMMRDAYEYYSTTTNKERLMIERNFSKIFRHWDEVINPQFNFSLQPLKFISSESPNNA